MKDYAAILAGGDLRSIGAVDDVVKSVSNQRDFDHLFRLLKNADRKVVMRAADAIEKITQDRPSLLKKHKAALLHLLNSNNHIELKWHLAQLMPRLQLSDTAFQKVWNELKSWAADPAASKIVRVNAFQSLHDMIRGNQQLQKEFTQLIRSIEREGIPSLNARIRKLSIVQYEKK